MSNPTGPQQGQGHQWGPPQGQYADQPGQPSGAPGQQAPGQQAPGQQAPGQQGGTWGPQGGEGRPGSGAQGSAHPPHPGQPAPGQQGPGPQHQGQHHQGQQHQGQHAGPQGGFGPQGAYGPATGGPQSSTATAPDATATAAAPVAGSSGMNTADVVRLALHIGALLLVVLGISLDLDDRDGSLWGDTWTWAGFATLMALLQGAAMLPRTAVSGAGWTLGAVGAGGLLLFWTLLMLPMISTNMAFLVTLGTACAAAAVLLSPDRKV